MPIHKAFRFQIYPNKEQRILVAKTIDCSCFVLNHFLDKWDVAYKKLEKFVFSHLFR